MMVAAPTLITTELRVFQKPVMRYGSCVMRIRLAALRVSRNS